MNEPDTTTSVQETTPAVVAQEGAELRGWLLGLLGWAVPGLGHLLLRKYDRAIAFFASTLSLGVLGLLMGAKLYTPPFDRTHGGFVTLLHVLAFVGDLGAGAMFFVAAILGMGKEYMDRALGDYGTVFFLCAGLLNLLTALDAYDVAVGKKG